MIYYEQKTGKLHTDTISVIAYSGLGAGLNNPEMEKTEGVGPIPTGLWHLSTWEDFHPHLGRDVCHLIPDATTETYGRSAFFIHGDNASLNHTASHGCIIVDPVTREKLRTSGEKLLTVTP